jgi:hypothetical protein
MVQGFNIWLIISSVGSSLYVYNKNLKIFFFELTKARG